MKGESLWRPAGWTLRTRLAVSFVTVIVLSVGLVTIGVQFIGVTQFEEVTILVSRRQAFRLVPFFADYYRRRDSWQGLESWTEGFKTPLPAELTKDILAYYPARAEILTAANQDRLILTDNAGYILIDNQGGVAAGQPLPPEFRRLAVPIVSEGRQVGQLLTMFGLEERISTLVLTALRRSLVVAGAVAGAAAVGVSIFLAHRLARPLNRLNRAVQYLASGETSEAIPVESGDEIGQLTGSFNAMAAALAQQKHLRRQMVADIAHELRTPLSVMQLDLEALQDGLHSPAEAAQSLRAELDALTRLVEDLRTLSLAEAGAIQFELEEIDLNLFLQRVADTWQTQAQSQQIKLKADIAPNLPSIQADSGRLAQALNNLLSNALRYTPAGGLITLGGQAGPGQVLIWVADTGPGIAAQELSSIFERFYRVDRARGRDTGGSGLGLAIAKQWVLLHGGHLWAESEVGQGTQFFISLPVA
jgi:two-component system OmpR family sensor kinase/two-component system sensor histidine kinase BaeS